MQRLFEYVGHHPWLSAATALVALAVLAYELRAGIGGSTGLSVTEAVRRMNQGALVIDLRSKEAHEAGHLGEARHIPAAEIDAQAETLKRWREKPILLYCETGQEGAAAVRKLVKLGFTNVANLEGGVAGWLRENMPLARTAANKRGGE